MDPSVAPVEELLDRVAGRVSLDGRVRAERALWICACVSEDDAPTWLVLEPADGLHWARVPDGIDLPDAVEAPHAGGIHGAPDEVLAWFRGTWEGPDRLDFGWGEEEAVLRLVERLRPA